MTRVRQGKYVTHRKSELRTTSYSIFAGLLVLTIATAVGVSVSMVVVVSVLVCLGVQANLRFVVGTQYLSAYLLLLALKFTLLPYQILYQNLPMGGVDWRFYDMFGVQLMRDSDRNLIEIFGNADWDLFTRFTAAVYAVFGADPTQMYFLVFASSLGAFSYICRAGAQVIGRLGGIRAAMLFMVWPHQIVMSVTFLREMPIQLLVAFSLYHFLCFWNLRKPAQAVVAITASLVATLMHSGMIVLPIAFSYLAIRNPRRRGIQVFRTMLFVLMLFLILRSPAAAPLLSKFDGLTDASALLQAEGALVGADSSDATTYYLSSEMSTVPIYQLPYRLVMFVFSPFPWQATSLGTGVAVLIEGLPRFALVGLLLACYPRFRSGNPRRDTLVVGLLLTLLAGYIVFCMGSSTYGTAIRHRSKFFPIEAVLACAAYSVGPLRGRIISTLDHAMPLVGRRAL